MRCEAISLRYFVAGKNGVFSASRIEISVSIGLGDSARIDVRPKKIINIQVRHTVPILTWTETAWRCVAAGPTPMYGSSLRHRSTRLIARVIGAVRNRMERAEISPILARISTRLYRLGSHARFTIGLYYAVVKLWPVRQRSPRPSAPVGLTEQNTVTNYYFRARVSVNVLASVTVPNGAHLSNLKRI